MPDAIGRPRFSPTPPSDSNNNRIATTEWSNAALLAASLGIHEDDDELFEIVDGPAPTGGATITSGTAAPSGGNDGDIYLQYSL